MNFDEMDRKLRVYENMLDQHVLPGIRIVVRLDGRNFTRLTKVEWGLDTPFDPRFRDAMLATTHHLMDCGFDVSYGYVQSDEISLLLAAGEDTFSRKVRKILSILAGEASACFSLAMQRHAAFDARISQLPSDGLVVDYFRWRHEDAHRNALNAHCYWLLRGQGLAPHAATAQLSGLSTGEKNELLFRSGTNFNDLPEWQRRGIGVFWEKYAKQGLNPTTGETTSTLRRRLQSETRLPLGEDYAAFVRARMAE